MALIELKNLTKVYKNEAVETVALDGIDFKIDSGEFIAIMGPSGSGKSTLLHILGSLDRPSGGNYIFEGKNMNEYSDMDLAKIRNKKMGFIFQAFNLLPRISVFDNVRLPLLYSDIKEPLWKESVEKAIESVGLSNRIYHEPSQLSGGEKQRVAIARALVTNPAVIFADEPTGNLDSKSGGQVMEAIEELHSLGRTIILITHETYTAEYAERIIRLRDGKIESDEKVVQRHHIGDHEFVK